MSNPINFDSSAPLLTISNLVVGTSFTPDQDDEFTKGFALGIDITTIAGGSTLTVSLQGKDVASGKYYDMPGPITTAALAAAATTPLIVYPGITVVANQQFNAVLPKTWRLKIVVAVATLGAATIGCSRLV